MRFIILILVAVVGSYFYFSGNNDGDMSSRDLSAFPPGVSEKALSEYYNEDGTIKNRSGQGGVLYVSMEEASYIDQAVQQKYYSRDYTDITLPDGTRVPLNFQSTGKICPRTNRPIMTISTTRPVAIPK